jgi:hypothetical protein
MCTISTKLKLCTCKTKDIYSLKNFWVLHRLVEGKNEMVLGEVMQPYINPLVDVELNNKTILSLLNDGNVFDVDIELKNRDLLHIAFKFDGDYWQHNDYGFEFKKGEWKNVEFDALGWMWHHEEFKYGKIKNAIQI